jgi:hypothetical protein
MILLWTSVILGAMTLTLIVALVWRERSLQKQLAQYRVIIGSLSEGRNIHQDGDAERFKRSQYFARIGTWDCDLRHVRIQDRRSDALLRAVLLLRASG